jgi:hypothetical protein
VTFTNGRGEFSLCALPQAAVNIGAYRNPDYAYAVVPAGQTTVELTLVQPTTPSGRHR